MLGSKGLKTIEKYCHESHDIALKMSTIISQVACNTINNKHFRRADSIFARQEKKFAAEGSCEVYRRKYFFSI